MIALKVLSPEALLVDQDVDTVFLPGTQGRFQVLKDHAPLISSLEAGSIVWRSGGTEEQLPVRSGFVRVQDNTVTACVQP